MGSTPPTAPGTQPAAPDQSTTAKSQGKSKFLLECAYHGQLGSFDDKGAAVQAAADHLHTQHSSAVTSNSADTAVQIREVTNFSIADLQGYEKPKQP